MHIAKIRLNPRSRQVQAELDDPYQMHRTLSKAFGNGEANYADARVLFRVDDDSNGSIHVLVQSMLKPDWSCLPIDKGYCTDSIQVKIFNPILHNGDILNFRLRANPTVRRGGKRLGIYKEDEQIKWLDRKGIKHGFTVLTSITKPAKRISAATSAENGVFAVAQFDGVLVVTDSIKFLEAMKSGIGSAKAFGFGLLSVSR